MRTTPTLILLLLCSIVGHDVLAQPDRDSLLEAWEAHIASLPGTARFEAIGGSAYRFEDTDLPYDGELTIVGVLVRPAESAGFETGYSHTGLVDFRLTEMPEDRLSSQVYYYWLTDRQTLHYSKAEARWVDTTTFQKSITNMYNSGTSYGGLSFMLNYGIWIFLIALIIFVFIAVGKQAKKARSLMDDSAAINEKAKANIDRAEGLQDELLTIARENRDLQSENNELLRKMLEAMSRQSK